MQRATLADAGGASRATRYEGVTAMKYATIGRISHGTCNPDHLIPRFASDLESLTRINAPFLADNTFTGYRDLIVDAYAYRDADDEERADLDEVDLLANLCDALRDFAPPYSYFGTADGSDYGYWPDLDAARESVEFVSSKAEECPADDYSGEWLHVNDHGNCTLYVADGKGNNREVWSIV